MFREVLNPEITTCYDSVFSGSAEWLNSFIWLLTRFGGGLSAQIVALWLFYKQKRDFYKYSHSGDGKNKNEVKQGRLFGSDADELVLDGKFYNKMITNDSVNAMSREDSIDENNRDGTAIIDFNDQLENDKEFKAAY